MSTNAPDDLRNFHNSVMAECGFSDPDEVGVVGDQAHEARGGYHISGDGIHAKGRFDADFSTKRARDHFLPNPYASAVDIGDDWPRGGRAAWLRFNNALLHELQSGGLPTLRAINFSPDGSARKRYDTANPGDGVINSTDTVTIHTHLEWWRDTNGRRGADLARLVAHIRAARDNTALQLDGAPVVSTSPEEQMIVTITPAPAAGTTDVRGNAVGNLSRGVCTPNGFFGFTGGNIAGFDAGFWANTPKLSWTEAQALCENLAQPAAAGNPASQADVIAALESPAGQAAIVAAANVAEDS